MPGDPDCQPDRGLPSIYQLTLTAPSHWARFGYPGYYIGTSMSSPEVAAAAALVIASRVIGRHPTPDQILARLEQTAVPLGAAKPNAEYGYGLLDAGAATAPGSPAPPAPVPPGTVPSAPSAATARPHGSRPSLAGCGSRLQMRPQASLVIAITIPASTNTTIGAWVQKRSRGI